MPRRLPWKTSGDSPAPVKKEKVKPENPRLPATISPSAPSTPDSRSRTPLKDPRRERDSNIDGGIKSPGTSPPPEPPAERFMIPGPLHDDRYRMVEDEFLNIAHQFTVHLHHAEYNRLKNMAKAQNAATIREIERPVVSTPTFLTRQRKDRALRNAKQRTVSREANGKSALPRAETGLRGLLESPRKEAKWISASSAGSATTRAAAGFGSNLSSPPKPQDSPRQFTSSRKRQLPGNDDESTEGSDAEFATPSRRLTSKSTRVTQVPSSATSRSTAWPLSTPRAAGSSSTNNSPRPGSRAYRPEVTPIRPTTSRVGISSKPGDDENDDDDDLFGIKERRIQRQKSRGNFRKVEQKMPRKEPSPDNMPSFM